MAYEAQVFIDKAKNKIIIEQGIDEDVQNNHLDIWEDELSMKLLVGGLLGQNGHDVVDIERAKRRVMCYHWQEYTLYFQDLVVLKLENKT